MITVLFFGGLSRSLNMSAFNALSFANVSSPQMSQATSFSSMAQQLAMSLGVALSAFLLHVGRSSPDHLDQGAFVLAFTVVGCVAACASLMIARLPSDAGAELAGRAGPPPTVKPVAAEVAAAEPTPGPAAPAQLQPRAMRES